MKKLLVLALCAGIFTTAKSQVYVQGGINLANITKNASGETQKNNMLTSFNAGILGRFDLAEPLAFETGLLVNGKGSKAESGSGDNYYKSTFNPLYIEVPANLVLRLPMENSTNIFINAGPYIAMGIAGKSKVEGKVLGVAFNKTEKIDFTSTDPTADDQAYSKLKRFDYGVNLGAGIDLGAVILKANYGMGLAKISSMETNNNEDAKNKFRTISVSVGIPLSGR